MAIALLLLLLHGGLKQCRGYKTSAHGVLARCV